MIPKCAFNLLIFILIEVEGEKRNSPVHLLSWLIIGDLHTEPHGHIPLDDVHGTTDETMAAITTNGTVRNKANTP